MFPALRDSFNRSSKCLRNNLLTQMRLTFLSDPNAFFVPECRTCLLPVSRRLGVDVKEGK